MERRVGISFRQNKTFGWCFCLNMRWYLSLIHIYTLLAKVEQIGAACHTGNPTCFFQPVAGTDDDTTDPLKVFESVYATIKDRKEHPKEGSYTNYLFDKGIDKILKKVGEECAELIIASKNPNPEEVKYEMSDLCLLYTSKCSLLKQTGGNLIPESNTGGCVGQWVCDPLSSGYTCNWRKRTSDI